MQSLIESSAKLTVIKFLFLFQIDSNACENTSSPVKAVISFGAERLNRGSINAVSAYRISLSIENFFIFLKSQSVPHFVTSDDEPKVVGTRTNSYPALSGLKSSSKSGFATSFSREIELLEINFANSALDISNLLPPPIPTTWVQSTGNFILSTICKSGLLPDVL